MNYIVAQCPKCLRWSVCSTSKDRHHAVFTCKFCNTKKRLYKWKVGYGPVLTDLNWKYFGDDFILARAWVKKMNGGRL